LAAITRALSLGGHRKADRIEPFPMAVSVLIDDLYDIAIEHGSNGFRVDHDINADGDLEVTIDFGSVADMVHFKLALPW
jgi:hypothetical protein